MKKLIVVFMILSLVCAFATAAPLFNTIYAINSTLTGFAINGMAYNPITNHIIARSSTAGLLYSINANTGQTTGQFLQPLPGDVVGISGGLDMFGIGVDYETGAIFVHSNASGATTGITYSGAIHRFANEAATPTLASATATGLARTLNIIGAGSTKFIYWTGEADLGPIHVGKSTDGGLTFTTIDLIPGAAGKSGVSADPRTINTLSGATIVYGQEHSIANAPVCYKWVKVNPSFLDTTTNSTTLRSDWVRDYSGNFNFASTDTTVTGFNPPANLRVCDSAIDTAFNLLVLAGRGQSGRLYLADPASGAILGSTLSQETNSSGLRAQVEISYVNNSVHRAFITNRYPGDGNGALGAAVEAIDYTPATQPIASPNAVFAKPSGPGTGITVTGGIAPYTWAITGPVGSLSTTGGSSNTYTPSSTAGSGTITITDSASQTATVIVQVTPTTAPIAPEASIVPSTGKAVVRFDLFE